MKRNYSPKRGSLPNVPQLLSNHLFGEKHTEMHRISVGMSMMTIGVVIVKLIHTDMFIISITIDGLGYFLHGMGSVPIIEHFQNKWKRNP